MSISNFYEVMIPLLAEAGKIAFFMAFGSKIISILIKAATGKETFF